MKAVYGYRIYTGADNITHQDIGLFSGVLCHTEVDVPGLIGEWVSGFVRYETLGDVDESVDILDGGNIAQIGGYSIYMKNSQKVIDYLRDIGVALPGKRVELYEIDLNSLTLRTEHIGVIQELTWSESDAVISVVDPTRIGDSCVSPVLSVGDYPNLTTEMMGRVAPVTFGRVDKAKGVAVIRNETPLTNEQLISLPGAFENGDNTVFPLSSPTGSAVTFSFSMYLGISALSVPAMSAAFDKTVIIGKYMKVVKGKSENEYRRISNASFDGYVLTVTVDKCFSDTPRGELFAEASDVDQTWVSIIDGYKAFMFDSEPCKGIEDEYGVVVSVNHALSVFSDDSRKSSETNAVLSGKYTYRRIPNFVSSDRDSTKASVDIVLSRVDKDIDTIQSVIVIPPSAVYVVGDPAGPQGFVSGVNTLVEWGLDHDDAANLYKYKRVETGLYAKSGEYKPISSDYLLDAASSQPVALALDKDYATGARIQLISSVNKNQDSRLILGFVVSPPVVDDDMSFDACYLLTYAFALNEFTPLTLDPKVRHRSWIGYASSIMDPSTESKASHAGDSVLISMIDDYYKADFQDRYFYPTSDTAPNSLLYVTGYNNFPVSGVLTVDQFRKMSAVSMLYHFRVDEWVLGKRARVELREVAFAFMKSVSLRDAVYATVNGRIYGGTWGGRKTATSLVDNPVDVLEYLDRRKNYQYLGLSGDWGLEEISGAPVNVKSTEGGYGHSSLNGVRSTSCAFQLFDRDECLVSSIQKRICSEFQLVKFRDRGGRECVSYIAEPYGGVIDKRVALSDIPLGMRAGDVVEPSPESVVSSRLVFRYNKRYADDSWGGVIEINHIDETVFTDDYVVGYDGGIAKSIWQIAHNQYVKFGNVDFPSSTTHDLETVRDASTAAWCMSRYLLTKGRRRIEVPVRMDLVRKWKICDHVMLNLPHQTGGIDVECMIYSRKIQRKRGTAVIGLSIYGDVDEIQSISLSSTSTSTSSTSGSVSSVSGSESSSSDSLSNSSLSSGSSNSVSTSSAIEEPTDHRHTCLYETSLTDRVLRVNNQSMVGIGEMEGKRKLHVVDTDGQTNTVLPILRIDHQLTTGSIAAGFGASMEVRTRVLGSMVSSEIGRLGWAHSSATGSYFSVHVRNIVCQEALRIDTDRKMWFDPAEAGLDTNLYRAAAAQLKTDGSLQIALALGVGTAPDTTSAIGTFLKDQNLETSLYLSNQTNETGACASIYALAAGANRISLHSASTLCPLYKAGLSNRGMGVLESVNFDGMLINNYSATSMFFGTNNTVRMTIDSAGALRINSTFEMPTYTDFTMNAYWNGAAWKHRASGFALDMYQDLTYGSLVVSFARSAAADATPAWESNVRMNGGIAFDSTGGTWAGQDSLFLSNYTGTAGAGNHGASIAFAKPARLATRGAAIAVEQTGSDADQCGLAIFTTYSTSTTGGLLRSALFDHMGNLSIQGQSGYTGYVATCFRDSASQDAYVSLYKSKISALDGYAHGADDDYIGHIEANAVKFDDSGWASSASCAIAFKQDGVAGASYVGGKIVFRTSTNAGTIQDSLFLSSIGSLGLGRYPTQFLDIYYPQNGATIGQVVNNNAGAAACALISATSDAASLSIRAHSAAFTGTVAGVNKAGLALLNASNSGGILLHNESNTPMYFSTNALVRLTIAAAGDIYSKVFTDYSGTSTLVGLGTPASTQIYYKVIGKLCWCWFYIATASGASGTAVSFTLPSGRSASYGSDDATAFTYGASGTASQVSRGKINTSGVVTLLYDIVGNDWAGGSRIVWGSFCYEVA